MRRPLVAFGAGAAVLMAVLMAAPLVTHAGAGFDQAAWDGLLKRYVDTDGRVAYSDLAARDQKTLDAYLTRVASAEVGDVVTKDAQAFWINAYNAGIVSAVLQGYTAENILRRRSIFRSFTFVVAGTSRTLDAIEHEILRPRFKDPRTHFALVCASSSCPKLRREAYTGANLDTALDEEARRFVNDPTRNAIDTRSPKLALSAIFEWFAADFVADAGSVRAFVARHLRDEAGRTVVRDPETPITYLDYDWTLNAQPGKRP